MIDGLLWNGVRNKGRDGASIFPPRHQGDSPVGGSCSGKRDPRNWIQTGSTVEPPPLGWAGSRVCDSRPYKPGQLSLNAPKQ